jgi:hypothetical protein
VLQALFMDTGAGGTDVRFHPYETFSLAKRITVFTQAAGIYNVGTIIIKLNYNVFCVHVGASGAATANLVVREMAVFA